MIPVTIFAEFAVLYTTNDLINFTHWPNMGLNCIIYLCILYFVFTGNGDTIHTIVLLFRLLFLVSEREDQLCGWLWEVS